MLSFFNQSKSKDFKIGWVTIQKIFEKYSLDCEKVTYFSQSSCMEVWLPPSSSFSAVNLEKVLSWIAIVYKPCTISYENLESTSPMHGKAVTLSDPNLD